ncbi:MAG: hypothetical protein NT075_07290 [Chloroflexi bacterium]|nr:hypothetical protein [Chloroflexota bacterium]
MNTLRKRSLIHVGILLATGLLIAACGGDTKPEPSATATVAAQAAAPTIVATAPVPTSTSVAPSTLANPTTAIITATAALSPTNNVTVAAASNPGEPCPQEVDLDLAGYPDLQAKMGCPLELANFDPIAFNEFGPGPNFDRFMLWISNENKIYVLQPDKTWQTYDDTWKEGEPTYTCNPLKGEPKSPPLPRRGFNKIWCTVPKLQEVMGTTVLEERQCQHAVLQRFQQGRLLGCYEDATIRYIRLLDNGTWDTELTR